METLTSVNNGFRYLEREIIHIPNMKDMCLQVKIPITYTDYSPIQTCLFKAKLSDLPLTVFMAFILFHLALEGAFDWDGKARATDTEGADIMEVPVKAKLFT